MIETRIPILELSAKIKMFWRMNAFCIPTWKSLGKSKQTKLIKTHQKPEIQEREKKKKKEMWKRMKDKQTLENFGFEINGVFWQTLKLSYLQ